MHAYGTKALRCLKLVLLEGGANFTGEKEEKIKTSSKEMRSTALSHNGNNLIYLQIAFL